MKLYDYKKSFGLKLTFTKPNYKKNQKDSKN